MQEWPDAKSWIANSETLLTDLMRLSDEFDEIMMRGPSTPPTVDMGQVEMNWAAFVATARKFSQRLRAAQTEVRFPVDANAIIRVADIVDDLNCGPQRWQTSTDEPDREHTTMEFKELYFERYVMCHHILADAISTFREYLRLNETADPETPAEDKPRSGRHCKPKVRRNALRDSQWHDWRHINGLTDAEIRDQWDRENPDNPVPRDNAENGLGVVASAIRREESRRIPGTG